MIIVGHRGARREAPENTIEGFRHAHDNGCRHFELDIQLSKDLKLMVFHDTSLKRTTGRRGKLADQTADSLMSLDARLNTPGWSSPCLIPRLEDLLSSMPDVNHWQFEVKPDSHFRLAIVAQKLALIINTLKLHGSATVTSSSQWLLKEMQQHYPDISTGYVAESFLINPVATAKKLKCDYLCISNKLVNQRRIDDAHALNMHVSVWTVNDVARMESLKAMGVDSLITDIPSTALARLRAAQ